VKSDGAGAEKGAALIPARCDACARLEVEASISAMDTKRRASLLLQHSPPHAAAPLSALEQPLHISTNPNLQRPPTPAAAPDSVANGHGQHSAAENGVGAAGAGAAGGAGAAAGNGSGKIKKLPPKPYEEASKAEGRDKPWTSYISLM